jgi:hypothetical protein
MTALGILGQIIASHKFGAIGGGRHHGQPGGCRRDRCCHEAADDRLLANGPVLEQSGHGPPDRLRSSPPLLTHSRLGCFEIPQRSSPPGAPPVALSLDLIALDRGGVDWDLFFVQELLPLGLG